MQEINITVWISCLFFMPRPFELKKNVPGQQVLNRLEYIHEISQVAKSYRDDVSRTRNYPPCLNSMWSNAKNSCPNSIESIYETSQMAKSYRDDVSGL